MPSKKKKYNARFPPARIKKIMQTDEDVGKVAAAVPVIISRALELFIETLITESKKTTQAKHAKTLSTGHIKQTILAEKQFDFLKDLVANIPDVQPAEDEEENTSSSIESASCEPLPPSKPPKNPSQRPRGRPRKNEDDGGKPRRKKRKVIPVAPQCDDSTESDEEGTNYTESKSGYQESSLNTAGTSKASATVVRSSTETLASSSSPPPRASSCSPQPLIIPCSADDAVPVCSPVHPQRALTPSEPFRRYAEHPVADHSPETHPPPTGHLQVEPSSENHQVEQAPIKRHHIDHLQSSQSDPVPESLSFPHVSHKHSSNNVMVSLHSADNGPRRAMSGAICMVPHHLPPSCSASGADFLPSHSTFSRSLPSGYPYDRPSGLAPQPEQTEVLDLSTPSNRASDKLMTSEDTPRVPAMTTTFSPLSQNKDPQYRTAVENMGSLYPRLPPYGYPSLHTLAPALSHLSGMAAHPYSSVPQSMQLPHEPSPGPRMFSQPPVAMPASLSHTPDDDYDS